MKPRSYALVEIVGTSTVDFKEAINNAVAEATKNHPHLGWFEVVEQRGYISENKIVYYQAHLKIGFRAE